MSFFLTFEQEERHKHRLNETFHPALHCVVDSGEHKGPGDVKWLNNYVKTPEMACGILLVHSHFPMETKMCICANDASNFGTFIWETSLCVQCPKPNVDLFYTMQHTFFTPKQKSFPKPNQVVLGLNPKNLNPILDIIMACKNM